MAMIFLQTCGTMELSTAIMLIRKGVTTSNNAQAWADLGAGTGLFTRALATLLPDGSSIYAIDRDAKALRGIAVPSRDVSIKKIALDFVIDALDIEGLDGILMANALHFVSDKPSFLKKMKQSLKPTAKIIIIEYDRENPNTWVPYPISYEGLGKLARNSGATSVQKIGSTPSKYHGANIYSALLSFT